LLVAPISGCNCGTPGGGLRGDADKGGADAGPSDTPIASGGDGGPGSSVAVVTCPGCPCFPGTDCKNGGQASTQPPARPDPAEAPVLVYPPDQVLFPPNTNALEVQFSPGNGNTLFEIDFENHATDVRIVTKCNPITNTRMMPTAGCGFVLDATDWHL